MTKADLQSYRLHKAELVRLEQKIEQWWTHDVVRAGEPGHTITIQGFPVDQGLDKLHAERIKLINQCDRVENFVLRVADPITRKAIELKYLEGDSAPTWRDIAQRMGGGNTEEGIKKRVNRATK